jgi:hypothetical protein
MWCAKRPTAVSPADAIPRWVVHQALGGDAALPAEARLSCALHGPCPCRSAAGPKTTLQAAGSRLEPTRGQPVVAIQDVVCELVLEDEEIVNLLAGVMPLAGAGARRGLPWPGIAAAAGRWLGVPGDLPAQVFGKLAERRGVGGVVAEDRQGKPQGVAEVDRAVDDEAARALADVTRGGEKREPGVIAHPLPPESPPLSWRRPVGVAGAGCAWQSCLQVWTVVADQQAGELLSAGGESSQGLVVHCGEVGRVACYG